MLLHPAVEADYSAIVDLANLAFRGSGANASWNTEAVFIEGQRLDESLLKEELAAKPEAQLLTYMRFANCRIGLLINFNTISLTDGLRRCVL